VFFKRLAVFDSSLHISLMHIFAFLGLNTNLRRVQIEFLGSGGCIVYIVVISLQDFDESSRCIFWPGF
jgi:hypothetical protein